MTVSVLPEEDTPVQAALLSFVTEQLFTFVVPHLTVTVPPGDTRVGVTLNVSTAGTSTEQFTLV